MKSHGAIIAAGGFRFVSDRPSSGWWRYDRSTSRTIANRMTRERKMRARSSVDKWKVSNSEDRPHIVTT